MRNKRYKPFPLPPPPPPMLLLRHKIQTALRFQSVCSSVWFSFWLSSFLSFGCISVSVSLSLPASICHTQSLFISIIFFSSPFTLHFVLCERVLLRFIFRIWFFVSILFYSFVRLPFIKSILMNVCRWTGCLYAQCMRIIRPRLLPATLVAMASFYSVHFAVHMAPCIDIPMRAHAVGGTHTWICERKHEKK